MDSTNNLRENFKSALKKVKAIGIIASIIMIILGIIAFLNPILGQRIAIWTAVAGLFIYGIEEIVGYCVSPKAFRSGFTLAMGIIWVVLCLILFISAINADLTEKIVALATLNYCFAVMISFTCIFSGINNLCLCGHADELGYSKGGMIFSGILYLLAGMIVLTYPIGAVLTLEFVYGVFLTVAGVALLCRCLAQ